MVEKFHLLRAEVILKIKRPGEKRLFPASKVFRGIFLCLRISLLRLVIELLYRRRADENGKFIGANAHARAVFRAGLEGQRAQAERQYVAQRLSVGRDGLHEFCVREGLAAAGTRHIHDEPRRILSGFFVPNRLHRLVLPEKGRVFRPRQAKVGDLSHLRSKRGQAVDDLHRFFHNADEMLGKRLLRLAAVGIRQEQLFVGRGRPRQGGHIVIA